MILQTNGSEGDNANFEQNKRPGNAVCTFLAPLQPILFISDNCVRYGRIVCDSGD